MCEEGTMKSFKPKKAWAIVWNTDGDIVPTGKQLRLDIFRTQNRAQEAIDSYWHSRCHIERVLITRVKR